MPNPRRAGPRHRGATDGHAHRGHSAAAGADYTAEEVALLALFLAANARVPIAGEPIDSIAAENAPGETAQAGPLSDFVYPHLEAEGGVFDAFDRAISYQDVDWGP